MIVATGATARQLGLESERALQGRGVSYCATCDASFFRDKVVTVVGGGDSAMEEAIFLARVREQGDLVHRRDEFRASQIMVDRARANEKIELVTPSVVEEVLGDTCVTAVRLRNVETGEARELETDGFFVAIGHDPNTSLFVDQLDHDETGYLDDGREVDRDEHPGRVRGRRRPGSRLPPGGHGRRLGLHGRARRRAVPGVVRGAPRDGADRAARAHRAGLDRSAVRSPPWPAARAGSICSTPTARRCSPIRPSSCTRARSTASSLPAQAEHEPRPALENHGDYVFGVLLVAVAVPDEDRVYYQEIDFVLTPEVALTVRKTPPGEAPFDLAEVQEACDAHGSPSTGLVAYYLVDEVAERYLELVDELDDEIDELEDGSTSGRPNGSGPALGAAPRHAPDPAHARRRPATPSAASSTAASTSRDDRRLPGESSCDFADAYDKLLRATEALDISRDLIAGARDYHQAKIAPRPERGRQEADRDRLAAARPDLHRRRLRPELRPLPRAPLALRLRLLLGADRR